MVESQKRKKRARPERSRVEYAEGRKNGPLKGAKWAESNGIFGQKWAESNGIFGQIMRQNGDDRSEDRVTEAQELGNGKPPELMMLRLIKFKRTKMTLPSRRDS